MTGTLKLRWLQPLALAVVLAGCGANELEITDQPSTPDELGATEGAVISESNEWAFFDKMNNERAARGKAKLRMQTGLRQISREWSVAMANRGYISHRTDLRYQVETRVTRNWYRIGENVGVGYGVDSLHTAFMNSTAHRDNVLGDYNYVGIGTEVRDGGKIWVTFSFLKSPDSLAVATRPAAPTTLAPTATGCGAIKSGYGLGPGQSMKSCDGRFTLVLQTDGNLVLYQAGRGAIWNTATYGKGGYALKMQGDGNLVLYNRYSAALWNSRTSGYPGAWLAVQNDGNLVVYQSGIARWNSGTGGR